MSSSAAAAASPASGRKQRKAWTQEEEDIMVDAIKTYGADFRKFVPLLPDRNIRQIRKHYTDKKHIYDTIEHGGIGKKQAGSSKKTSSTASAASAAAAPDSAAETTPKRGKKGQWSDEEEALFIHQLQKYGKSFSKFTIPGRTKFALSSHYYVNKVKYESIDLPSVKKTRNSTIATTTAATSTTKKKKSAAKEADDDEEEGDDEEETESPKKRKASSSKDDDDEVDETSPDERETQRRRLNDEEGEGLKYIPLFAKNTYNSIKSYCTSMYNRWIG